MNSKIKSQIAQPLRPGLLATAAIGWGFLREWWFLGVILAVLIESPRFIPFRKDFQAKDYLRVFNLSTILLVVVLMVLWLQGVEKKDYEIIIETLPLFFVPVILCQRFSNKSHLPLHATSFITYWRSKKDKSADIPVNFEYAYIIMLIIASSWNLIGMWYKAAYALLIVVIIWRIFHNKSRQGVGWYGAYTVSVFFAALIMLGMILLSNYLHSGKWLKHLKSHSNIPEYTTTEIGQLGELKLSSNIEWRVMSSDIRPPLYLKSRVYNLYASNRWFNKGKFGSEKDSRVYKPLKIKAFQDGLAFYINEETPQEKVNEETVNRVRLRGKSKETSMLPIGNAPIMIHSDSLSDIEHNTLGGFLGKDPVVGAVDYTMYLQNRQVRDDAESDPDFQLDLAIPDKLEETLDIFLSEHSLKKGADLSEASLLLKSTFLRDFEYTLDAGIGSRNAIQQFLLEAKRGHCEYYATSGVLLLRRLGIPARYTVGFSVQEYDYERKEWILRGVHSHSWVRAWDQKKRMWVDVEFTPNVNSSFIPQKTSWTQKVIDTVLRWRQDLSIWRSENTDSWIITVLPWLMLSVLALISGYNLLKVQSRKRSPLDRLLLPLCKKPFLLPIREEHEPHESWLRKLPEETSHKQDLINAVEVFIYGKSSDEKVQGIRKLVRNIRAEAKT